MRSTVRRPASTSVPLSLAPCRVRCSPGIYPHREELATDLLAGLLYDIPQCVRCLNVFMSSPNGFVQYYGHRRYVRPIRLQEHLQNLLRIQEGLYGTLSICLPPYPAFIMATDGIGTIESPSTTSPFWIPRWIRKDPAASRTRRLRAIEDGATFTARRTLDQATFDGDRPAIQPMVVGLERVRRARNSRSGSPIRSGGPGFRTDPAERQ